MEQIGLKTQSSLGLVIMKQKNTCVVLYKQVSVLRTDLIFKDTHDTIVITLNAF